jgi:hypothetical protein
VLSPWVAYFNQNDERVGTTDGSALLGVRNNVWVGLERPVKDVTNAVWTGFNADWTTNIDDSCDGWTSSDTDDHAPIGNYGLATSGFIYVIMNDCQWNRVVYCVEQ